MGLEAFYNSDWFKSRPEVIQKAYRIWKPSDKFLIDDKIAYLLGFAETDESDKSGDPNDLVMILSYVDPCIDYEGARTDSFRSCAKHFRKESIN